MAKSIVYVSCPACGRAQRPSRFGLDDAGRFDAETAPANESGLRIDHIGGRAQLRVERQALPVHFALGLREMLKARLAQLDQELADAGVVLES